MRFTITFCFEVNIAVNIFNGLKLNLLLKSEVLASKMYVFLVLV